MVLREILVKLGLDIDAQSFAKGELAAKVVEKGFEKLVEIGAELVHSFIENIHATAEYGDHVQKTSQKIGVGIAALQELEYAADLADVSAQALAKSFGILAKKISTPKGAAEMKALGIETRGADGKMRSAEDVFGDIADKIADMPDGIEKTALSMKLLGKSGKDMIPLLNEGKDGIAELREEAREMGMVMSAEATKASEELNDNLKRLQSVTIGLWRGAVAPMLPAINKLVKRFLDWRKANAEIMRGRLEKFIKGVVWGIDKLANVLEFLITNINGVIFVATAAAVAFGLLSFSSITAAASMMVAWIAAAAPILAAAAAVAFLLLLFDDIRVYMKGGKSVFGSFVKILDEWLVPKSTDPYFVVWVKDFIRMIESAISWLARFDHKVEAIADWYGMKTASMAKGNSEDQRESMRKQAAQKGTSVRFKDETQEEADAQMARHRAALGMGGESTASPISQQPEMVAPPARGSAAVSQVNNNNVVINATEGMTVEELRPMVQQELQSHSETINEQTNAALSSY